MIDKSKREDGTLSREDFRFDTERNVYICPAGKVLTTTGKLASDGGRSTTCHRRPMRNRAGAAPPIAHTVEATLYPRWYVVVAKRLDDDGV